MNECTHIARRRREEMNGGINAVHTNLHSQQMRIIEKGDGVFMTSIICGEATVTNGDDENSNDL